MFYIQLEINNYYFTEGLISIMFYRTLQATDADCLLFTDQNKNMFILVITHRYNAMFNEK